MPSISNITSSLLSSLQATGTTSDAPAAEAPARSAPVFLETLTTQGGVSALGLGAPRNHGDIEAIFAEIATKYGVQAERARDYAEAAEDAKRSTSLTAAIGNLAVFATLGSIIIAEDANIRKQEAIINQKTQQINQKTAEKNALQALHDQYRDEKNANTATIAENEARIVILTGQLATVEPVRAAACALNSGGAECRDLTQRAASLTGEISALQTQNAQLSSRNAYLDGEMSRLSGEIRVLSDEIAELERDRSAAQASKRESEGKKSAATTLLNAFALVLIPFTVDLALHTIGAMGRASFETSPGQNVIDRAVSEVVDKFADQAARLGAMETARKTLEQDPAAEPAIPSGDSTVKDRPDQADRNASRAEPAMEPPRSTEDFSPGSLDPAAMIGVLTLIRQAVQGGIQQPAAVTALDATPAARMREGQPVPPAEGQGPPDAMDLIRRALETALPPGEGDADLVLNRAAGLAAGLTLLRGALDQLAQGEGATLPQMPGPSGRLALVI